MTFRVPKIKSCCCFSLETGSKLLGCFQTLIFVAALSIPPIIVASRGSGQVAIEIFKEITNETVCLNFGIFAVIMLFGAAKGDHQLILPWILLQTLFLLKFMMSMFAMLMYLGLLDYSDRYDIGYEFILIIYFSLSILVVHNFYRKLEESSGRIW